jgi:hypothetical protein
MVAGSAARHSGMSHEKICGAKHHDNDLIKVRGRAARRRAFNLAKASSSGLKFGYKETKCKRDCRKQANSDKAREPVT